MEKKVEEKKADDSAKKLDGNDTSREDGLVKK